MQVVDIRVPKEGNSPEECEDSLRYTLEEQIFVGAVADGASQGYESRVFSRILCDHFVSEFKEALPYDETAIREKFQTFLDGVIKAFDDEITEKTKEKELKWYEENAIKTGSFSTFLGVVLNSEKGEGYCIGVGDCFLFQIKPFEKEPTEEDIKHLPIVYPENYAEQSNTPYLLATESRYNGQLSDNLYLSPIKVEKGDAIIMATDAFSYFLIDHLENRRIIKDVPRCSEEGLRLIVDSGRKNKNLKNDDVAVIILRKE